MVPSPGPCCRCSPSLCILFPCALLMAVQGCQGRLPLLSGQQPYGTLCQSTTKGWPNVWPQYLHRTKGLGFLLCTILPETDLVGLLCMLAGDPHPLGPAHSHPLLTAPDGWDGMGYPCIHDLQGMPGMVGNPCIGPLHGQGLEQCICNECQPPVSAKVPSSMHGFCPCNGSHPPSIAGQWACTLPLCVQ